MKVKKKGKRLVEYIKKRAWSIVNGGIRSNEKGNWMYTGNRRESVIGYVLVKKEIKEEMLSLEIGGQVDSDHHLSTRGRGEEKGRRKG